MTIEQRSTIDNLWKVLSLYMLLKETILHFPINFTLFKVLSIFQFGISSELANKFTLLLVISTISINFVSSLLFCNLINIPFKTDKISWTRPKLETSIIYQIWKYILFAFLVVPLNHRYIYLFCAGFFVFTLFVSLFTSYDIQFNDKFKDFLSKLKINIGLNFSLIIGLTKIREDSYQNKLIICVILFIMTISLTNFQMHITEYLNKTKIF